MFDVQPHRSDTVTLIALAAAVAVLVVLAAVGTAYLVPSSVPGGIFGGPADGGSDEPAVTVQDVAVDGNRTVLTYETPEGTTSAAVDGVAPGMVDADADWAYLPRSTLPPPLEQVVGDHDAGVGAVGRWAVVGNLAAASVTEDGAGVTVVAPAGMDVDPERKARFLARYVGPYALQTGGNEPVTLYIAPDAMPSQGRMYDGAGYITQHGFWDGQVSSVWIHEYVHSQQAFRTTTEMRWIREASATYLSARLLEEQFRGVAEEDVRGRLDSVPEYEDVVLANRSSWAGSDANYHRGAKVLYLVDAELRAATDGNRTFVDVIRAMNAREEPVTVAAFVAIVEGFTGKDEDWLQRAITEPGDLDGRVQRSGAAFEASDRTG